MAGPPRFVPPCAVPTGMPVPNSLAEHQLIERTAGFVAANGEQVLGALAVKQGARLPFLHPAHPLHGYFRLLMLHFQRAAPPQAPRLQQGGGMGGRGPPPGGGPPGGMPPPGVRGPPPGGGPPGMGGGWPPQ